MTRWRSKAIKLVKSVASLRYHKEVFSTPSFPPPSLRFSKWLITECWVYHQSPYVLNGFRTPDNLLCKYCHRGGRSSDLDGAMDDKQMAHDLTSVSPGKWKCVSGTHLRKPMQSEIRNNEWGSLSLTSLFVSSLPTPIAQETCPAMNVNGFPGSEGLLDPQWLCWLLLLSLW